MNRALILISYPGEQGAENYALAVDDVLQRWKKFFMSPIGGFWNDREIFVFNGQSRLGESALTTILSQLANIADYSVIMFCGHGGRTSDGVDAIQLPGGELFKVSDLFLSGTKPLRRIVIVDACRSIMGVTSQLLFEQKEFAQQYQLDGDMCKQFYDDIIMKQCAPHYELYQSTEKGKFAYFSGKGESHYLCNGLIYLNQSTKDWLNKASQSTDGKCYTSFLTMHNQVSNFLKMYNGSPNEQHPESYFSNTFSFRFPLAGIWLSKEKLL